MNASPKWLILLIIVGVASAGDHGVRRPLDGGRPTTHDLPRYPLEEQLLHARSEASTIHPPPQQAVQPRRLPAVEPRRGPSGVPIADARPLHPPSEVSPELKAGSALHSDPLTESPPLAVWQRLPPVHSSPPSASLVSLRPADSGNSPKLSHDDRVHEPALLGNEVVRLGVEELVAMTLANSPRVRVIRLGPLIEQQRIGEAEGRFDWTMFLRNRWLDSSRPAGSELDVGVPQARLLESNLQSDVGLRRINPYGGQLEATQVLQGMDSNSVFFTPNQQALTNLTLRYSQPLLRDRGTVVNQGQVVMARHMGDAAGASSRGELADHLLQVVEAYWDIYRMRAYVVIQQRLFDSTRDLLDHLRRRQQVDASRVMIIQAEATALSREAGLVGAKADLRRAQNQLIRLVGATSWDSSVELLPTETPYLEPLGVPAERILASAVQNRPEVAASLQRIKAAEISTAVHENQLLPQLALVLENSLFGLRGDNDLAGSWWDQFSRGRPTWSAGLNFEYPLANQTAKARLRRAELEAAREVAAMADVVQQVRLEVMNAVVELETAYEQLQIRRTAREKATQELESLERRRQLFPEADRIAILYLQELLESQQRLALAEREFVDSESAHAVAILRLRRAEGTLWQTSSETSLQVP